MFFTVYIKYGTFFVEPSRIPDNCNGEVFSTSKLLYSGDISLHRPYSTCVLQTYKGLLWHWFRTVEMLFIFDEKNAF